MTHPFAADMARTGLWLSLRDTPVTEFQVLGERASGTNYIRKLIELNCALRRTEGLGWKHGFPHMVGIPAQCLVIGAVRAAEPWALSMHKRPWHAHPDLQAMDFSDFIRAPWRSVVDRVGDFEQIAPDIDARGQILQLDRHPITGRAFDSLFALRRAKLAALAGLAERGCSVMLVQMETVTRAGESFVEALRLATGAAPRGDSFRTPKRRMGNNFRRRSDAQPATPDAMSDEDRAFMTAALDGALEAAFGYGQKQGR